MTDTKENMAADTQEQAQGGSDAQPSAEEIKSIIANELAETRKRIEEAQEVMKSGKGRLKLETPINAGGEEITELVYDFTELTGLEYTDAMDSDMNAENPFRVTRRQALALFAKAAAKQMQRIDMQDILAGLGMTDAVEAVELASLFFSASTRAGRMRISKK